MEKYTDYSWDASRLSMRYGKQEDIEGEWKKIISEKDKSKRKK